MKLDGSRFLIYDVDGVLKGELTVQDQKEAWPVGIQGWKHTLDCAVPPYLGRPIEENLKFAARVNKKYVIVLPEGVEGQH
jgi:hypothetical protein